MISKLHRIRLKSDFDRIFKCGHRTRSNEASVIVAQNNFRYPRFTVVVGTNVSKNATKRNRLKRVCRDVIRVAVERGVLRAAVDLIVVCYPKIMDVPDKNLKVFFESLLRRARIV